MNDSGRRRTALLLAEIQRKRVELETLKGELLQLVDQTERNGN